MCRSLAEIESLLKHLKFGDTSDKNLFFLAVLQKLFFAIYWGFDNIGYLIRAKFVKLDKRQYNVWGAYGWFLGSLCALVSAIYELQLVDAKLRKQVGNYKQLKSNQNQNQTQIDEAKAGLLTLYARRNRLLADGVRYLCDVIVAGNQAEFVEALVGQPIHDGHHGMLGFVSAVIGAYQVWNEPK